MKAVWLGMLMLSLVACSEQKPLTKEQQWQGYCKSFGHAARAIMLDRQSSITREQAIEHANKVPDTTIRTMLLEQIDLAYQQPQVSGREQQQEVMLRFMQAAEAKCLATPYTDIPKFKPL